MILDLTDKRVVQFKNTVYVLTAIAVFFLLTEGALRIFWPQHYRLTHLDAQAVAGDKESSDDICRKNARWIVETPEYKVEYHTNNDGMRDKTVHLVPKPKDMQRILVVGDSFALGAANDYDQIWPVLLEKALLSQGHSADVVKAGVLASDLPENVVYLEKLLPKFRPDIVVISFHSNDLLTTQAAASAGGALADHKNKDAFRPIEEQEQGLYIPMAIKYVLKKNDFFYTYWSMKRGWGKIFSVDGQFRTQAISRAEQNFLKINDYVKQQGAKLVVLSLPDYSQVLMQANGYQIKGFSATINDDELSLFAKQNKFMWLSALLPLAEKYRTDRKDLFFRSDGHLNAQGNLLVAEYLYRSIRGY